MSGNINFKSKKILKPEVAEQPDQIPSELEKALQEHYSGTHKWIPPEMQKELEEAARKRAEKRAEKPPAEKPKTPDILHIHDNITFRSGVALGGWFDLVLNRRGDITFTGHFHDSGADSYDTGLVILLMTPDGVPYSAIHQGHTAGTFESGSRNDDWVKIEHNDVVAQNWDNQFSQASWRWTATANSAIEAVVGDLVKQLAQSLETAAVSAVIALI